MGQEDRGQAASLASRCSAVKAPFPILATMEGLLREWSSICCSALAVCGLAADTLDSSDVSDQATPQTPEPASCVYRLRYNICKADILFRLTGRMQLYASSSSICQSLLSKHHQCSQCMQELRQWRCYPDLARWLWKWRLRGQL
jgi:hypothetical protein